MSFFGNLFRPIVLHADHTDDGDDMDEAEQVQPVIPATPKAVVQQHLGALKVVGGGWFAEGPGASPVKVVNIATKRTQRLVHATVDGFVFHWTATRWGTAKTCAKRIAELPKLVKDKKTGKMVRERAASFHGAIERDGTYYQCAPLTLGTWHGGGATAKRFLWNNGKWIVAPAGAQQAVSVNSWAAGIELVNLGEIRHTMRTIGEPGDGKLRAWPFDDTAVTVDEKDTVGWHNGRRYHRITDAQVATATYLLAAAVNFNPQLTRESCSWTHSAIDPTRKTDAGPIWTDEILPRILDQVFGK